MDSTRLEELKKLSRSVLRHPELVELARDPDLSPSEVRSKARDLGWPTRPAKAARFLAIVLRDFGSEALEAFITQQEHARSEMSETEHAQERKQMENRLKRSLERLSDPRKKLELMVKHDLLEEARELLFELVDTMTAYFDYNSGGPRDLALFSVEEDRNNLLNQILVGFHPADTDLKHSRLNIVQSSVFCVDFRGAIQTLEMSPKVALEFVRKLLEKMVSYPIYTHYFVWIVEGMQKVVRHFLQSEDELAKRVEKWMLLYRFRDGRMFELRQKALPNYDPEEHPQRMTPVREMRYELNPIVDRMIDIGMSEDEVYEEFLNWLKKRKDCGCNPHFLIAVAGAMYRMQPTSENTEPRPTLRTHFLKKMWEDLLRHNDVAVFSAMGEVGLWKVTRHYVDDEGPGDEEFFKNELIRLISEGKAGLAYQLIVHLGGRLGLYSEYNYHDTPEAKRAQEKMEEYSSAAFELAFDSERFGVAAALAQQFSCFDKDHTMGLADQTVVDDVVEIMGESIRDNPEEINDVLEGIATEESDEDNREADRQLMVLREERDSQYEQLKRAREDQKHEALELATDLDQPICLDWMVYIAPTKKR